MSEIKPSTPYQWEEDAKFELSGKEFELFINVTRAILSDTDSQKVLAVLELNKVLEQKLVDGIQNGIVQAPLPDSPPAES